MIGFTDLVNVSKTLDRMGKNDARQITIGSSMFVIMVRGLIKGFNFPYASFPADW